MTLLRANRLEPDRSLVLVIDLQEKLLPLIHGADQVLRAARQLLDAARIFDLPVLVTEQYPKGIGATHASLREALAGTGAQVYEKSAFSVCGDAAARAALRTLDRGQIVVTGIESHVCVQQTVLDLCAQDYEVFVCADAIGSRGTLDHAVALERMKQEGAFITTVESALFEWCHQCGTDRFKAMLEVIKANPPRVG